MDTEYSEPERRKDWQKLDDAIKEVQRLHGTTEILAEAVVKTVPKHELEALRTEMYREFKLKIAASAVIGIVIALVLVIFISVKLANLNASIKHGHDVISCMQGKVEAQRTGEFYAPALVTCEQTVR